MLLSLHDVLEEACYYLSLGVCWPDSEGERRKSSVVLISEYASDLGTHCFLGFLVWRLISDPGLFMTIGGFLWSRLRMNSCFSSGVKIFF